MGRRPHEPGRLPRPGLERRHPAGHVPGYICIRPDLGAVRLTQSQGDGRPLAVIWAPVQHGRLARGVRAPYAGGEDNQNVEEPITT